MFVTFVGKKFYPRNTISNFLFVCLNATLVNNLPKKMLKCFHSGINILIEHLTNIYRSLVEKENNQLGRNVESLLRLDVWFVVISLQSKKKKRRQKQQKAVSFTDEHIIIQSLVSMEFCVALLQNQVARKIQRN